LEPADFYLETEAVAIGAGRIGLEGDSGEVVRREVKPFVVIVVHREVTFLVGVRALSEIPVPGARQPGSPGSPSLSGQNGGQVFSSVLIAICSWFGLRYPATGSRVQYFPVAGLMSAARVGRATGEETTE